MSASGWAGPGFSNRRLYLMPQFFETKAVERLLGPGITAEDLNDDCLGRTLDMSVRDVRAKMPLPMDMSGRWRHR